MRILACQAMIPAIRSRTERDAFVESLCARLDSELDDEPTDLVLLPELTTIDYSEAAFQGLGEVAETLDGPSVRRCGQLARRRGAHISLGLPRRDGRSFRISQVFIDPRGEVLGFYDKLHLVGFGGGCEEKYFVAGNRLALFEICGLRLSTVICYDFRFSALLQRLCLDLGADLIVHPVAFEHDSTFASWRSFVVARALEFQVHFVSLNRAGARFGGSVYCPPWVDDRVSPTVFGDEESFVRIDVAGEDVTRARARHTLQRDRRSDYRDLEVVRARA